jgi:hypothetical protein
MSATSATALGALVVALAGCGHPTIHVNGVMQQPSEMRPLPSVPLGGYQQLHLFVHAAPNQEAERYGSPDCGYAPLEGSDEGQDLRNAACVPVEALNTAVRLVRQRLRSYGVTVARDGSEPYDYEVEVSVTGEAPRQPDRALAKALAKVTFKLHADATGNTLLSGIDRKGAAAAFDSVTKDCGLHDADLSSFSSSSRQPMTPDFDIVALTSDVVDDLFRCESLAHFFIDVRNRFPKTSAPEPAPATSR